MRAPLRCRLLLALLSLAGVWLAGCASPAERYAKALELEQQGKLAAAVAIYQELAAEPKEFPGGRRSLSSLHARIGENLWRLQRGYEAFQAYGRAIEIDPENYQARARVAALYLAGGSVQQAADQARAVVQVEPENAEALTVLGAVHSQLGQVELARQAFERALQSDPSRTTVAIALAELCNQAGDTGRAREVLTRATEAQPKMAAAWLALGRLEEQQGNSQGAEHAYRSAVAAERSVEAHLRLAQFYQRSARIQEGEEVLRRVDQMQPEEPSQLADFHLLSGQPGKALQRYLSTGTQTQEERERRAAIAARIITADLESAASLPQGVALARQHLNAYRDALDGATAAAFEAEIALYEQNLPVAVAKAEEAVRLAPQSAAARYLLGLARLRGGDAAAARTAWLEALEHEPYHSPTRLALADDALAHGDFDGAEQYASAVVREEPANLRALTLFSRVLLAQKRYPSARSVATRAAAVDASAPEPYVLLGNADLGEQKIASALVHFQKAILQDSRNGEAIAGLLRVYRGGQISHAMLRKMESVAEAQPPSATLMEIAGRLYAERGFLEDSRRALQRALEMDQQRSTAATALGKSWAATGNVEAAANVLARTSAESGALLAGVVAQQRNDETTAIAKYEVALRQGDTSGVAANNLAWILAEKGQQLDRALALAQQARELAPRNPAVLDTLAAVHLKRREFSQAVEALRQAVDMAKAAQVKPEYAALLPQLRERLAGAYLASGQPELAEKLRSESAASDR